jgi:hypothetical protein
MKKNAQHLVEDFTKKQTEIVCDQFKLTVRASTVSIGMHRTLLMDEAFEQENKLGKLDPGNIKDLSRRIAHVKIYPSLIAATVEAEGFEHWPPTFEEFCELPEGLEALWEGAVYELNSHWLPQVKSPDKTAAIKEKPAVGEHHG